MTQIELFPLSLLERAARHAQARAHDEMLRKVNDAHGGYVSETGQMYADHVIFTDGDVPTFTIIREFWPDMTMTAGQIVIWRTHVRAAYGEAVRERRLFSHMWHS